jgi:transposase
MKKIIQQHLGLSNVSISSIETNTESDIEIVVKSTLKGTHCHRCHEKITAFYDYDRELTLRHLSILGQAVYIKVRFPRYECKTCDKNPKTTQQPKWHKKHSSFTTPYEDYILLCVINSTETDVSKKEGITNEQVKGMINRSISKIVDWNKIEGLSTLGIDEISLKKGHQSFVVVISSIHKGKQQIIGLLKGRKKETVKQFLLTIPEELKKTVKWICSDMYEGYINASKEIFGKETKIVVDRFHVAKLYRSKLDALRKQEMKCLKKTLSAIEYKGLKGAMWALRRSSSELSEKERDCLNLLFRYSEVLEKAYTYSEQLTQIFNDSVSRASGIRRLKSWIKAVNASSIDCFSGFIHTLHRHFDDIANYFILRKSSGFVEGLNNKIKVIKRRCYGIFRLDHLFQRIFLDIQGYALLQ